MITVILVGSWLAYSLIATYWWRRWAWESYQKQRFMGKGDAIAVGLGQAVVWPIALAFKVVTNSDTFMLAPPTVRANEREAMLQARIDQLEREVGVKS